MDETILKENWPIYLLFVMTALIAFRVMQDRSRMDQGQRAKQLRIDAMLFIATAVLLLAIIGIGINLVVNQL